MRRASLIHRDQERTKYAPSHETHTVNNSVDEPRQIDAVKERHQPRIEPRITMHLVIVPSEIVDIARPPILGPLLLLAHDPGVLVAVVGDDAPAQDIVGDNEAAGAQQPRAAAGRRPGEDGVEVVRVAGLLGVDEDEVVRLAGSTFVTPLAAKAATAWSA
ncbi:hypothetical protein HYQ46_007971 [Verticillium longisporum]|nr:hypothetical protein HYQ46_007971 [Verticillium longisporum]